MINIFSRFKIIFIIVRPTNRSSLFFVIFATLSNLFPPLVFYPAQKKIGHDKISFTDPKVNQSEREENDIACFADDVEKRITTVQSVQTQVVERHLEVKSNFDGLTVQRNRAKRRILDLRSAIQNAPFQSPSMRIGTLGFSPSLICGIYSYI